MRADRSLTLKEAANLLDVHYMTVYRYVRLGMLPATKEGANWTIAASDLATFQAGAPPDSLRRRAPAEWQQRLQSRLMAGDERGAWRVVEAALASGLDPVDIYEDMLTPAMTQIGDDWASAVIDVADEHRASAVATRIVGRLGPRFARRGRSKGRVITATPAGDYHGLGLSVVADLLRGAGFEVIDLACNVPPRSLAKTVAEAARLRAVALSSHNPDADLALEEAVDAVRAESSVPIILGGYAVPGEDAARRLGADGWAPSARSGLELIEELIA